MEAGPALDGNNERGKIESQNLRQQRYKVRGCQEQKGKQKQTERNRRQERRETESPRRRKARTGSRKERVTWNMAESFSSGGRSTEGEIEGPGREGGRENPHTGIHTGTHTPRTS